MKLFLLIIIRCYWFLIPPSRRNRCLFKKSCSRHVYEITKRQGLIGGMKALRHRFRTCRPGYFLFQNPMNGEWQLHLVTNEIINETEIAEHLL